MRKILPIVFSFFCVLGAAQETLPVFQQYLLDGNFLLNPAHYGESDEVVINGNYQKQFSKFDLSPNVQSIGVHANIFDRVGAGVAFFRDENGPVSSNGITAGASYFIPLGDDQDRRDQFSFGTAVNFYNMNIDLNMLNAEQSGDPLLQEGGNDIFIAYVNLGGQFTYRNFFGGLSVLDIPVSNDVPVVNGIEPSPTKYLLNAGYDWPVGDGFSLEPSLLVNLNTNSSHIIDLNLLAKVYSDDNLFAGGVSFRTADDVRGGQKVSISPLIKGRVGGLTFGATYNIGMSDIQQYGGNSFMLSLGYRLENFINPRGFRY